jgi:hypothetical protein
MPEVIFRFLFRRNCIFYLKVYFCVDGMEIAAREAGIVVRMVLSGDGVALRNVILVLLRYVFLTT